MEYHDMNVLQLSSLYNSQLIVVVGGGTDTTTLILVVKLTWKNYSGTSEQGTHWGQYKLTCFVLCREVVLFSDALKLQED